ncbi:Uncharacterized protein SCF082_LOCUS48592, partial [Durusdinium trenchii]
TSRSSATSVHWAMPELSQVMLMVDTATPQLEVEQAHLSFLRAGKSLAALRELVRPTEWETVRGEIEHYLLGHEEAKEPLHLRPLRFRMSEGSKDYMVAERVEISVSGGANRGAPKLVCHLEDFTRESPKRKTAVLEGIAESLTK